MTVLIGGLKINIGIVCERIYGKMTYIDGAFHKKHLPSYILLSSSFSSMVHNLSENEIGREVPLSNKVD